MWPPKLNLFSSTFVECIVSWNLGFWQILLCVDCLTCLLILFSWTQAGRMLAKRFLIITSNSYAHTKGTYKNWFPYKVCKVKFSEWSFRHLNSKLEKVDSRYSQLSLCRTPRCNGQCDNTDQKNLRQKLQMFDRKKTSLLYQELRPLLLIGATGIKFLSLQRTPTGTEVLRAVTGIFLLLFKKKRVYSGEPSSKNNNVFIAVWLE